MAAYGDRHVPHPSTCGTTQEVITRWRGICAFGRTEQDGEELFAPQREFLSQKYQAQIVTITLPGLVDVSSTRLRELLARGRDRSICSPRCTAIS